MSTRAWGALSCAGLLAAGGCASMGMGNRSTASADPGARQVAAQQEQSERALEEAQRAQKRASDQARKAAQADQEVQGAQRRLAEARERARLERQKAQQLQQEANQATERASQQARESQRQASQTLAGQTERSQRGEQMISGQVLRASDDQLVVRPQGAGDPMTFRVTEQTRVRIAGQRGSAADLRQGEDARVAYRISGTEPIATEVQVMRSEAEHPSTGSSGAQAPGQEQQPQPPQR